MDWSTDDGTWLPRRLFGGSPTGIFNHRSAIQFFLADGSQWNVNCTVAGGLDRTITSATVSVSEVTSAGVNYGPSTSWDSSVSPTILALTDTAVEFSVPTFTQPLVDQFGHPVGTVTIAGLVIRGSSPSGGFTLPPRRYVPGP